jgi:HEAT repeat protein
MAKKRALEETLKELHRLRADPGSEASQAELRRVLGRESSLAVAKAAAIVGDCTLVALVADLTAAFDRFFAEPVRSDPGCAAKRAIVEALRRLDHGDLELYRRGSRHVQMEPVWGGQIDTAVDLRPSSALALAEHGGDGVLTDLADLLADPEPPVRISAAHAVFVHGRVAGIPLLHLKALAGDPEPRVVTECLLALLRLDAEGSLPFVASFLDKPVGPAEAAAAALGESRLPNAFPVLQGWLDRSAVRGLRRVALRAIASLRRDEAVELLLSLVADEPAPAAREALEALASVGRDDALGERVRAVAESRPELAEAVTRAFGLRP